MVLEVDLSATVLSLGCLIRRKAEASKAQLRLCGSQAVDVPRGQADGASQAHIQGVQVCAFAAEIAGLQHGTNISAATAADLGIAEGVLDDPLIDGLCLFGARSRASRNFESGRLDDSICRHEPAWAKEVFKFCCRDGSRRFPGGQIDGVVLEGDATGEGECRPYARLEMRLR